MVFLGTSSCASGHKKTFFQVLCFYLLVRTQDVCYTNRLMRTIQKSSLWWSFLLLQRIYEDFFVGTWKCPHNLNRPHFAGVYTYECPHRCAKVHAHTHTHTKTQTYKKVFSFNPIIEHQTSKKSARCLSIEIFIEKKLNLSTQTWMQFFLAEHATQAATRRRNVQWHCKNIVIK